MNKRFTSQYLLIVLLIISYLIETGCTRLNFVDYVNPFVGTDDHGHTFPGADLPGGMVQLSPDTGIKGWDWCSGYHYSDSSIMGFSHLHRSGMGGGDWGDILLMPTNGEIKVVPGSKSNPNDGYRSRFTHQEEEASPGYYAVNLKDYDIKAELTVSERAGFHRYTFPKSNLSHILIDMEHGINDSCIDSHLKIVNNTEIEGYRSSIGWLLKQTVYFCAQFSKPFNSFGIWEEQNIRVGLREKSGKRIGAFVDYLTSKNEVIEVKVGISYLSIAQARMNLDKEISHWNFDRVKENAKHTWNKALSKIEVQMDKGNDETYNKEKLKTFYTALYHSLLFPAICCDVNGKYMGLDDKVHIAKNFTYRSEFSLWDTYRAQMPLMTLIKPKILSESINTMVCQYEQGGWLPTPQQFGNSYRVSMIGDHPVNIILDSYMKGIRNFDVDKAYESVRKNAMEIPPVGKRRGRKGLNYYLKYGYIPYDKLNESVSRTMEYAYNDWCIAQLAKALGKDDDYEIFIRRAYNYKNVMDTSTGFARPKNSNDLWLNPFDPRFIGHGSNNHYTEANAWQYTWFVPHDIQGLINIEGGRKRFIKKLDSLFTISSEIHETRGDVSGLIGQYAQGNEPSHHTIYLYNYAGAPWKAQNMVRKVMENFYSEKPGGLCGNEDMGQMSSWYVFSALGFYPVTPGQSTYVIGSPLYRKAIINLGKFYGNKKFIITANNVSEDNKYIQSATLNGKPLLRPWITHNEIVNGGKLEFEMGLHPNIEWGASPNVVPPSMSHIQ